MEEHKGNLLLIIGFIVCIVVFISPLLYIIGNGDLKMTILLMFAQSATMLETMIGIIGMSLLAVSMLIYWSEQDHIREQIDNIESKILEWTECYEWFEYYLKSAKLWQDRSSTIIFYNGQEEMEKHWVELKNKTEDYNLMLKETYGRLDPLNTVLQRIGLTLRVSLENDYEKSLTISLILAVIGTGLLILAIILPGTDSMLSLIADQMVDPSLQGEDRITEILKIKDMLKSL